jgi:hypothetical protein
MVGVKPVQKQTSKRQCNDTATPSHCADNCVSAPNKNTKRSPSCVNLAQSDVSELCRVAVSLNSWSRLSPWISRRFTFPPGHRARLAEAYGNRFVVGSGGVASTDAARSQ